MYMNVKKGLDQLFLSQVLSIVVAILGVVTALFAALTLVLSFFSSGLGALIGVFTVIFTVGLVAASIGGFVLGLLGILNASKDEISYKNALVWLIIGIAASIIAYCFGTPSKFIFKLLKGIFTLANGFATFMVMYSVLNATAVVANAIGNVEVYTLAQQRANSFKTLYIVGIILAFFSFIPVIGGLLSLAGAIIGLVVFFQYLGFLSKAKMMV